LAGLANVGIASGCFVTAPAHASTVLQGPIGTWTTDNAQNCRVPTKVYQIDSFHQHGEMYFEFRNVGNAKTDVEVWSSSDGKEIGTTTISSMSGEPNGTRWSYEQINNQLIQVWRNGVFYHWLIRCDDTAAATTPHVDTPTVDSPSQIQQPAGCYAESPDGFVNVREEANGKLIGPVPVGTPFHVLDTWNDPHSHINWSRIQTPWLARVGRTGIVATYLIRCN
jgi:hypothetical protein